MHYITTSVNVSQEHSLFFSLSIQSKERGGGGGGRKRLCWGRTEEEVLECACVLCEYMHVCTL